MSPEVLKRARDHALSVLKWSELTAALAARCASLPAAREAAALLPSLSREAAELSLRETDEALALLAGEDGIPVSGVRDVGHAVDLASRGGLLEPAQLADIARTVEALLRVKDALDRSGETAPLLRGRARAIELGRGLVAEVDRAIDERGAVRDDASPRLLELHRRRTALGHRIERTIDALRRDPDIAGCLTDDFVTVRDGRHVLPVRSDRRLGVQGILHGRSGSGHSLFVEPAAIVDLNNELAGVGLDVEEEIARILRALSARVASEAPALLAALQAHRDIDLAVARALLSRALDASTPAISDDGDVELLDLAHPRLLLLHGPRGRSKVVRNDVRLLAPKRGIVITGPNTGGKTVLLEALGLACLMVRAGLPPACAAGSRLPFLDAVLADIGDEQSLERSLSSFSGHVAQLKDVLEACRALGGSALVLVDEIMAGTDPAEGAPLAQSMLEALACTGARVVVTTHLGFLKAFAAQSGVFENGGMEFDEATLRPTYRLRLGVPGASAALFIAEKLGLDEAVVLRARELADTGHLSVEALLLDLERARQQSETAREQARRSSEEARELRERLERQLRQVESRDAQFMREERAAFERRMQELREEAAAITRALQQQPSHAAASEAVRRLQDLRARAEATGGGGERAPQPLDLRPGARVRSLSLDRPGVVVDEPDARGRVRVRFGHLTMQVGFEDLAPDAPRTHANAPAPAGGARKAPAAPPRAPPPGPEDGGEPVPFTPQTPRNALDMRGMTVEEGLAELAKFLERASAGGERCVVLIHGHGTGALKSAVRSELRGEPLVRAFRAGREGEGGDGVTIARMR